MFSSLFAVLELGGRCAASLSRCSRDLCSELSCQRTSLTCVNLFCLLYLLRYLCGYQGSLSLLHRRR